MGAFITVHEHTNTHWVCSQWESRWSNTSSWGSHHTTICHTQPNPRSQILPPPSLTLTQNHPRPSFAKTTPRHCSSRHHKTIHRCGDIILVQPDTALQHDYSVSAQVTRLSATPTPKTGAVTYDSTSHLLSVGGQETRNTWMWLKFSDSSQI